ncbi:hypothetical protein [Solilutibacter pythonis]|uniref:hypothetical protein n=1 Tax=Solilutibacter pythonis TaxID=2483112 RepID=UPI0013140590|nr:hypothetical protein [Lysobacter pythonis]
MRIPWLPLSLLPLAMAAIAAAARADDLTLYRCLDAKGRQTLRDSPCQPNEKQQTRQMIRPRDPPRAPVVRTPPPPPPPPMRETVRYMTLAAPRPLYECQAPDGGRYTSESPQGRARWQPLWIGLPVTPGSPGWPPMPVTESGAASIHYRDRHTSVRIDSGRRLIGAPIHGGHAYPVNAGTWVYDTCTPLPQAEVCARLSERQSEIRRRYFQAMPSERATLDRESAGIDTRLATECPPR